jgi:membrane protease YdiL (CAAX protease family)
VPFGLWWTERFVFFGSPYVLLRMSGRGPFLSTGFTRPWAAGCLFGFALGFANFFAVVAPIQYVAQKISPKWLLELYDASKVFQDKGPVELVVIVLGIVVAAPLGEEYFFRGTLQRGWSQRMGPVAGIIVTGAVFSAFHMDPVGFPARWELGVLFGLLAWRSGSLWPGIFGHLANNLTSTVLYFAFKDEKQDPTDDVSAVLAITGIGGLLMLAVLLIGRRFPKALQSPQPAREELVPAAGPSLPAAWAGAGLATIVALAIVDFRGSVVRGIDLAFPVKSPDAELKADRHRTISGDMSFGDYAAARRGVHGEDGGPPSPP